MTSTDDSFDRLLQSIDRIDTIRTQSAQIEQALGSADRDKLLVEKLMATYQAQGIDLDRSMVEKAVSQTLPTRSLEIPPPAHRLAHSLARVWIRRTAWVRPLVVGLASTAIAIVLALGVGAASNAIDANKLDVAVGNTTSLSGQVDASKAALAAIAIDFPVQSDLRAEATASLQKASTSIQQAKALSGSGTDPGDIHEPIAQFNKQASRHVAVANATISLARQIPAHARQIEQISREMSTGTGWPQLDEVISQRMSQVRAMLSSAALAPGLPVAISELNDLSSAAGLRSVLAQAAKDVPPDGADQVASLVAAGEAALLSGQADQATKHLQQLRDLARLGAASYTLRITNEPNERTGVWRHHSNSPNARNHYIVVDAIDASGNAVSIPVINEETGQRHEVSRFAVRVPERIYEQVGADKTDNGLVDNNTFGTKKPGTLKTQYAFDVEGGMITDW